MNFDQNSSNSWLKNQNMMSQNNYNSNSVASFSQVNPHQMNMYGMNGMGSMNGMSGMNNSLNSGASTMHAIGDINSKSNIGNSTNLQPAIQHDKAVKVYDSKTNKPIDSVPNQLKLPVPENEIETEDEKEAWVEQQRYLGFSKQKFNTIIGVHIAFLALSLAGLIVCVVLFVVDPGTDYEWKLFGIISCGGLALCLFFGIIFLLLYAKYKYERSKEEFENEMKENKDPHGNDIKKAGLTNIYKYSKPADETVGYLNENENIQTPQPTLQPHQFIMPPIQPFPQFQQIEPPTPQHPVKTVIMKSKPKKIIIRRSRSGVVEDDEDGPERVVIRREPSDSNISRRVVKVHREPSQKQRVQVVEREQSPQQIVQMVKREPSRQVVHVVQEENPEVVYVQQKKKDPFSLKVMAKNLIKKVRGTPQEVISRPSNYIVEKQEPTMREIEIRSPSHIQAIAIEPQREIIKTPRIIKISRNEMVSSRTPISSNSRTQLIETSSDKRPVILNKNFGENLNAFN